MTTFALALLIGLTIGLGWAIARDAFDAWQWQRARSQVLNEHPDLREWESATLRWQEYNAEARRDGCLCGRVATHVRRVPVIGSTPKETWTCQEHVNVNQWNSPDGVSWTPSENDQGYSREWGGVVTQEDA